MTALTITIDVGAFGSPLLTWASVATVIGAAVAVGLFVRRAPRLGIDRWDAYGLALAAALGAFVGARAFHVLEHVGFYASAPWLTVYIWRGGLALWGAIAGGTAVAWLASRRRSWPLQRLLDAATVPSIVAILLSRVGSLLAGDLAAAPSTLPWAVDYPGDGAGAVHLVAAYELVWTAAVLGIVAWLTGARHPASARRSVLALGLYAAGRFVIGFARAEPTAALGLSLSQIVSIAVAAWVAWSAWRSAAPRAGERARR
ncbi:MAG: hypothetical protein FJ318_08370 [SAR202 cluster bacterium]|nr:hypothetical protein [SAR202 cluster bacterium]